MIHNLITSRAVPDFLGAAGARTVRTRVGHSFIKAQMAEHDAVFGGEHSAHYYFRDFFFADTGMLAAMHVLAALGSQPHALSDLAEMYEPYVASGEINSTVADVPAARARVVEAYVTQQGAGPVEVDELDGLTVSHWGSHPQWWFNLRASTPSRSCGSTSRPRTRTSWRRCATTSCRSCAKRVRERLPDRYSQRTLYNR